MLYSINFLRFVASVGVVIHHALSFTDTPISVGAAGVDVFFIISGIVIGFSTSEKTSPYVFFAKRFIRVLPLYWLATLAYQGFRYFEWRDVPSWETFGRSMFLWPDFGTGWHPIYYPGWTLGYELFFYLVFGAIFTFSRKNAIAFTALTMCCVSLVLIPVPGKTGVYFESRLCFEFVLGLVFAHLFLQRKIPVAPRLGTASVVAALIVFALNYKSNGIDRALAWGVPSLLLVIGFYAHERSRFFQRPLSRMLGEASYSIYLVHITVIELILETLKRNQVTMESIKAWWPLTLLVLVGMSVVVGVLVNRFIEQPLLNYLRKVFLGKQRAVVPPMNAPVDVDLPATAEYGNGTRKVSVEPIVTAAGVSTQGSGDAPESVASWWRKGASLDEQRLGMRVDWPHLVVPLLLAAIVMASITLRIFDWPHAEDFLLVDFFRQIFITDEMSFAHLLGIKYGPHLIGFPSLVSVILFKIFGVSFNLLVVLNIAIVTTCAVLVSMVALADGANRMAKWIVPVWLLVVFLHPTQMNHLVWPFELGWFLVTLALVVNIALIEFLGVRAIPWVVMMCLIGMLSTGQGGFLWALASAHFFLREGARNRFVAMCFLAAFVVASAYLASTTGEVSGLASQGFSGIFLYFLQLFGGVFGVRGDRSTGILGAMVLATAIGLGSSLLIRRRELRAVERAGIVLLLGSLLMAAGFTLARFKFGIEWALDRFHAAPMLVPLLAGIVLLASDRLWGAGILAGRAVALLALVGVAASAVTAAPYAVRRLDEEAATRGVGMAVVCDGPRDSYLEIAANGLLEPSYFLIKNNRAVLSSLCTDKLPINSRLLLKLPADFASQVEREPASADGLTALWRVYQTHGDLQRAFPPSQPDVGKNLLMFARNNALTGSQYEKDLLGPHADLYVRLHDAK